MQIGGVFSFFKKIASWWSASYESSLPEGGRWVLLIAFLIGVPPRFTKYVYMLWMSYFHVTDQIIQLTQPAFVIFFSTLVVLVFAPKRKILCIKVILSLYLVFSACELIEFYKIFSIKYHIFLVFFFPFTISSKDIAVGNMVASAIVVMALVILFIKSPHRS